MSYLDGFILAVPKANRETFINHAATADPVFTELGATKVFECWEDDVPDGTVTDFRRAVQATPDEAIVFSWMEWPDKPTRDAAMAKMMSGDLNDDRMDPAKNPMPFDGKRMIFGGFAPIVDRRFGDGAPGYIDGFVAPVSPAKRQAYIDMAEDAAGKFGEAGALFDVEGWGDDVKDGKVTDFRRSVKAESDEAVVFSFIGWPDKATRDAAWAKMMEGGPPAEMPFDGKRMFWGGFTPVVAL